MTLKKKSVRTVFDDRQHEGGAGIASEWISMLDEVRGTKKGSGLKSETKRSLVPPP
jgi:hypothetical protein